MISKSSRSEAFWLMAKGLVAFAAAACCESPSQHAAGGGGAAGGGAALALPWPLPLDGDGGGGSSLGGGVPAISRSFFRLTYGPVASSLQKQWHRIC
jgi:hypothetical protein